MCFLELVLFGITAYHTRPQLKCLRIVFAEIIHDAYMMQSLSEL